MNLLGGAPNALDLAALDQECTASNQLHVHVTECRYMGAFDPRTFKESEGFAIRTCSANHRTEPADINALSEATGHFGSRIAGRLSP